MTSCFKDLHFLKANALKNTLGSEDFTIVYALLAIQKHFLGVRIGKYTFKKEVAFFLLEKNISIKRIKQITGYSNTSLYRLKKELNNGKKR